MGGGEGRARVISGLNFNPKIAYFSMEIFVDPDIHTYSGGLGMLAGDTMRTFADLNIPVVAVTLLSEKGYLRQRIVEDRQVEEEDEFDPSEKMLLIAKEVVLNIRGEDVKVRPWCYFVKGTSGYSLPVIFLDTNVKGNSDWARELTSYLYGGDPDYRLAQEIVLGIGGFRILKELNFSSIYRFHMNEGHASFLTLELYRKTRNIDFVRRQCVFTTHTPVKAGHDSFSIKKVEEFLGYSIPEDILPYVTDNGNLNMTKLGMFFSHYINGVAKKHKETSSMLFPHYSIDSITNGVHSLTWVSEPFKRLFDRYMPGWRQDPYILRSASGIPSNEVWHAHMEAKKALIDYINNNFGKGFSHDLFTIGFARRMTAYKRPYLLFYDEDRLREIARSVNGLQIVYSGKAHPKDEEGKRIIERVIRAGRRLEPDVRFIFIPNYDFRIAKLMVSGVDLWLNTPRIPMEASGTSGMKAAHNGVPQLSTLDGWWKEGYIEGVTGWAIGEEDQESDDQRDSRDLYDKLEYRILPIFYKFRERWIEIMKNCIALNASFFNTQRMVEQYVLNAYFL